MKTIELSVAEKALLRAADYIEKHGWCQHRSETPTGVCAMNAIYSATAGEDGAYAAVRELERRVNRNIINWNDSPLRTKEEVVATMRGVSR